MQRSDRVVCVSDVGIIAPGFKVGEEYTVQDVDGGHLKINGNWLLESRFAPAEHKEESDVVTSDTMPLRRPDISAPKSGTTGLNFHVFKSEPKQHADRHNEGKGEHDYLLTYPGGIDAVFAVDFAYYDTLKQLADWYRGDLNLLECVVDQLRDDAKEVGHDLAAALAETNARGAAKYAVGNYLKGANYRQYCQSAIRHAQALQRGETHDAEGNNHLGAFVFNILALDMCVTQGIGVDDRIRKPEAS